MFEEDRDLVERWFVSIYSYLSESAEEYRYKIHVSDLIYDCMRKAYYAKVHPTIVDIQGALRMAIGKAVHEIPFVTSGGHEVELEMDGVVCHIDEDLPDRKMIIDKKTCRKLPREPYPHHVKQVEMYAVIAAEHGYEIERLGIIYINVGDVEVRAFSWKPLFDPVQLREEMLLKKEMLLQALKTGVPPPRNISWECSYCYYAWQCFTEVVQNDLSGLERDESKETV